MKLTKFSVLASLVLSSSGAFGITISDLAVKCSANYFIQETSDPVFINPLCNHCRYTPPAKGYFTAKVLFSNPSPECIELKSKYGIDVDGLNTTLKISLNSPKSLNQVKDAAEAANHHFDEANVIQSFLYKNHAGVLPLFPFVHQEGLAMTAALENIGASFSVPFSVDVEKIYGVVPVDQLEPDKLWKVISALEQQMKLSIITDSYYMAGVPFENLLTQLKPKTIALNKMLFSSLVNIMDTAAAKPYSDMYFNFYDGGANGAKLALSLNQLSHVSGLLTDPEKVQLLTKYPALMLVGWSETCFAVNEDVLKNTLENLLTQLQLGLLPSVTAGKYTLLKLAKDVKIVSHLPGCLGLFVTEHDREIAQKITDLLN